MIQFRRLVSILLGLWLGANIVVDLAVTQNFSTVDRFLASPGSVAASIQLNKIGRADAREILRRNAAEENNVLFDNFEIAEAFLGAILFLLLLFGDRPQISMLAMTFLMLAIVLTQHFALSPQITAMGRNIAALPKESAAVKKFWMFHGFYSGSELLKIGIGIAFAARLIFRNKQDPDMFKKQYEASRKASATAKKAG